MERNKFSVKVNVIDGLLSVKSVFDRGSIGDIDGTPMFVNAFLFDDGLYVKYIEVSAAPDGRAPESLAMAPAAVFLLGETLTIPRSGNFVKIAAGDYSALDSGRGASLARVSARAVSGEGLAQVGDDEFLVRDFLVDTRAWKIAAVARGNWAAPEISRVSKLVGFSGEERFEFLA